MNALHQSYDQIVRSIQGHVNYKEGGHASWFIGRRNPVTAQLLARERSILLVDTWNCSFNDAQKIIKHFVSKGMVLDEGPLQINAANGVYIYRRSD